MEKIEPVSSDPSRIIGGGQVVPHRTADLTSRHSRREATALEPVSQSSYLNENDRTYRAAKTLDSSGTLVAIATDRILEADRNMQEARAEGASPMALAAIERLQMTYGTGAGHLVDDFMNRPYERW